LRNPKKVDAVKGKVGPERDASKFDAGYYGRLLEKAWAEAEFVFSWISP
jgi:hypothetical protein